MNTKKNKKEKPGQVQNTKSQENKVKILFGSITGIVYIIFGFTQFIISLGVIPFVTNIIFFPRDIIGGVILVLLGAVFWVGVKELKNGFSEGVAYVYVGIFLALLFCVIYIFVFAANAVEVYLIMNEDFSSWTPWDDLRPGLYLVILPLVGYLYWQEKFKL